MKRKSGSVATTATATIATTAQIKTGTKTRSGQSPSLRGLKGLKVALAHDYLREYGGAERVLEELHRMFPEAPVYTAFVDSRAMGRHWPKFADWDIRQSWLTKLPLHRRLFSPLRVWAHRYFRGFDLSGYDLVISSTNAYMAKAVRVPHGVHVCYCHTPSRSLYGYTTMTDWRKNPLVKLGGELINHYLRIVDFRVAQDVDHFIANSRETARRIDKFWRRDATVIHPPVNVPPHPPTSAQPAGPGHPPSLAQPASPARPDQGEYYLYVNRLALAKHPELAVAACNRLGLPLKVVGTGPMLARLREAAGAGVELLGAVSDQQLHRLYAGAKTLLYPAEDEDFGMVPVEAMGHGVPVIAHRSGGPSKTVIDGRTGVLFDELSEQGLVEAIERAGSHSFDRQVIYRHARQFSRQEFVKQLEEFLGGVTARR